MQAAVAAAVSHRNRLTSSTAFDTLGRDGKHMLDQSMHFIFLCEHSEEQGQDKIEEVAAGLYDAGHRLLEHIDR